MSSSILSDTDREMFVRDGFIKLNGLIPSETITETRSAIVAAAGLDASDPETWAGKPTVLGDLEDRARLTRGCRTPEVKQVARELVGPGFNEGPNYSAFRERAGLDPWGGGGGFMPVLRYPEPGEKVFQADADPAAYHLDGLHLVTVAPTLLYLVLFLYLSDVTEYGGATVVLPGSHRQIFEHYYPTGQTKIPDQPPRLDYRPPVPVAGKAGDMIFMHYLLAHRGSPNHDAPIRVALNSSIQVDRNSPYRLVAGPPTADWTPFDYTLRTDNLHA